jgi:class 3 adenylate cyclase/DNA-binding XRE family transcriptional regulator/tetratricopeptide (TPR) repeat protein
MGSARCRVTVAVWVAKGRWAVAEQPGLSFAGLLRQLRAEARLTQEELAEAAMLSARTVSDLERGISRSAHKDTAVLLANALGLAGPVREVFVAAARGRVPAAEVLAARADAPVDVVSAGSGSLPVPAAEDVPAAPASHTPRHVSGQVLAVRGAVAGERKQVTVLFCDIVGFGDLAVQLEPEDFHQAVERFFQVALAEVRRYEGTVSQFLGDGFMALFGAPVAHEDDARRAALAALGIVAQAELQVRMGINSGLVVAGTIGDDLRAHYTAIGYTTVLAARLQAAAGPGAVLVSQRTARALRGYFVLEEVPPVQVGERTVRPLRLIGPGTRTAPVAADDVLSPFTERDTELAGLGRALEVAAGGEGQVVGLVGEPGLGKSRLALEFRLVAQLRAGVLEGRCPSYGAAIPYLPLFELVRRECGIAADDAPDVAGSKIELKVKALELDVSLAQYLQHAFGLPARGMELAQLDRQAIRARTFGALRALLAAEAARRPLLVLVEDLHWIDQTSQDFLAEFVGELASVPVLLLVTYRPGYSPPWIGKSFASQLALRPLSPAAGERIVASILGDDPDEAAAIAARGEGNPFFLEELARAARDQADGAADGSVPETVQQVLAARIDKLDLDQKAALQLAAVLGREFTLDLAEDVWDGQVPLNARLEELKGLEFLRERHGAAERTFVFKHALTREVAYDGMLRARRRELHGRAAAALEHAGANRFEHSELLAHHYSRSAEPARAIPHLAAAGDKARDRFANEEAIALYRQAITLIEEQPADLQADAYRAVCEHLGDALWLLSRYDQAIDAYRKGLAVASDPLQRAHLHVRCGQTDNAAHRYPEALVQCDRAEQALGPAPDTPGQEWLSSWLEVQRTRMTILYWLNDTQEYSRLIERVRPFVEAHGSARQRANFLSSLLSLAMRRDRYLITDQTLEFARAADAAGRATDPLAESIFNLGFALLWHGDLDEATAVLEESLQEAKRRGYTTLRSRALTYLMAAARKRGDVDGVREAIGPVIDQAREAALPEYEAMAIANRAWVAWRTGHQDEAAADARAALDMWLALPVRYFYDWMALWPLVAMALTAGRVGEAIEHARGMLPPPQQLLQEPLRTLVADAVQAQDERRTTESEQLLRLAIDTADELGYL